MVHPQSSHQGDVLKELLGIILIREAIIAHPQSSHQVDVLKELLGIIPRALELGAAARRERET